MRQGEICAQDLESSGALLDEYLHAVEDVGALSETLHVVQCSVGANQLAVGCVDVAGLADVGLSLLDAVCVCCGFGDEYAQGVFVILVDYWACVDVKVCLAV